MRSAAPWIVAIMVWCEAAPAAAQAAPSPRALAIAVRRFVAGAASVDDCRALGVVRGEHQYSCSVHSCAGGCQSRFVVTVLGFRGARARVVSREARRGGDTGRCGCCA